MLTASVAFISPYPILSYPVLSCLVSTLTLFINLGHDVPDRRGETGFILHRPIRPVQTSLSGIHCLFLFFFFFLFFPLSFPFLSFPSYPIPSQNGEWKPDPCSVVHVCTYDLYRSINLSTNQAITSDSFITSSPLIDTYVCGEVPQLAKQAT